MWNGESVRESTKQGNDKIARQMEAAHKTSLAKGEVGIRDKRPVPTLKSSAIGLNRGRNLPSNTRARTIGFGFVPGYGD